MRFDRTWPVGTSPAGLRALAVDTDRRRAAMVGDGSRRVRVSAEASGGTTVVHVERRVPTGARGLAVAVVGRFLAMSQTERWSAVDATGAVSATVEITFAGRPITVAGRIEIAPTATGSAHRITGEVDARVPGVGRLLEARIAQQLLADLDQQLTA